MRITRVWLPLFVMGLLVWCGFYFFGPKLAQEISHARESGRQRAILQNIPNLKRVDSLSQLLRQVSRAVKPAVVEIRVSRKIGVGPRRSSWPGMDSAVGSGVIVNRHKGYVVTNEHVIAKADEVTVILADGRKLTAQWVRSDVMTDLAVIKIPSERLLDIELGDSDKMEVGDQVLAVGSPMRLPQTVTFGRISAKGRMTGRTDRYQNYLQTDAAINHGNSGGPLINTDAKIIGINTAIVSESGTSGGLGLAIPSNIVKRVIDQLIEDGKTTRGFIGLAFKAVDQKEADELDLPGVKGALVTDVARGGPADNAGIEPGDFILSVDSRPIISSQDLRHVVADLIPGENVPVKLYRDGEVVVLSVKIAIQPADMNEAFRRRL